ncbi:MAG: peptidyl-prolyl cis-trans isomerase [Anaerolineae bacterium]|nr:peptidyl-prolyl cis-trans isomerase [Phycisphaerae bacterium]
MNRVIAGLAATLLAGFITGCGSDPAGPAPLVSQSTNTSPADVRRAPVQDRPGPLVYDNARADQPANDGRPTAPQAEPVTGVSEAVKKSVRTPSDAAVERAGLGTSAATIPSPAASASQPGTTGVGTGGYLILGKIIVEVNGKPIPAERVLDSLTPVLVAKARELNEQRFRVAAAEEIQKQLRKLIMDELEYAIAEHSLDAQDKRLAEAITMMDRQELIRKSGGSLQLAKQAAAAQGRDFDDDLMKENSRANYVRVYYQKYEFPRVQISADDIRRYYQRHQKDLFTDQAQARFRVIKIDFKRTGGRDKALVKAKDIQQRIGRGDDFATLAGSMNDDAFLAKNKGDVSGGSGGWVDRGAYANQKVDDAVWLLQPGQVSDMVESGEAFYIVKLEQKKEGRVRSFDEEAVQTKIRENLTAEQLMTLRQRAQERLMKNAVIEPEQPNIGPVVEMAMQRYREWSGKN